MSKPIRPQDEIRKGGVGHNPYRGLPPISGKPGTPICLTCGTVLVDEPILTPKMSEADLLEAVLGLCKIYGWRTLHIRAARTEKGWSSPVQGDGKGFPDVFAIRGDDILAVELKDQSSKTTPDQDAWLSAFLPHVVNALMVWRPADWHSGEILRVLSNGEAQRRTEAVMAHPRYNELRALAAEPNTSNQITAEDVRKRLLSSRREG